MASANSSAVVDSEVLKDIVFCADCRLREVLRAMRTATSQDQEWMQKALVKEIVSE
jgi:hypothetical protein